MAPYTITVNGEDARKDVLDKIYGMLLESDSFDKAEVVRSFEKKYPQFGVDPSTKKVFKKPVAKLGAVVS